MCAGAKFLSSSKGLISTSTDKTACLWTCASDSATYSPLRLTDHTADVTAVAVHASRDYFVTASADRTWCFYEAATGTCLQQARPLLLRPLSYLSVCTLSIEWRPVHSRYTGLAEL